MDPCLVAFLGFFAAFGSVAVVVKCRKHRSYAVFKPIPMLMLIGMLIVPLAGLAGENREGWLRILILSGLVLGLAGDLFLLNAKKYFLQGLAAFLLGHIAYISALAYATPRFVPAACSVAVFPLAYFMFFQKKLSADAKKKFLPAITAYFLVITVMMVMAVSYDIARGASVPVYSIGALVFCLSDAVLAWTVFIRATVFTDALVLATYYVAQLAFASAAAGFF